MSSETGHLAAAVNALDAQKAHVLAILRSYGPTFDHELQRGECGAVIASPALVIADLQAGGYRIDAMRCYRKPSAGSGRQWVVLYALKIKLDGSGEVITAPALPGAGPISEIW